MLVIPLHAVEHRRWPTQQTSIGASHKSARGLHIPIHPAVAAGDLSLRWQGYGSVWRRKLPPQEPRLGRPKHSGPHSSSSSNKFSPKKRGRNNIEAATAAFAKSWRREVPCAEYGKLKRNRALFVNVVGSKIALGSRGKTMKMRNVAVAADRIDFWIRRRAVPCAPRSNVNPALDRNATLTAIGRSLRDQYDALAAPLPPNLAALVKRLEAQ
jgi:hypothetical protein